MTHTPDNIDNIIGDIKTAMENHRETHHETLATL